MPWNQPQKKFIRDNGRNTGPTIWNDDAVAAQPIDSLGHDNQDQDIADGITQTLNLNGFNNMLADLDCGTFKLVNVGDGTVATDGVNYGQLSAVDAKADQNAADILLRLKLDGTDVMTGSLNMGGFTIGALAPATAGLEAVNKDQLDVVDAKADQNATDIANIGAVTSDDLITAQAFDGDNLTSTRTAGNFVTQLRSFLAVIATTFKSKGEIRHLLNNQGAGNAAIDVSTHNRHRVNNNSSLTMTFSGLPSADDPDLGADYQVEGQVVILNDGSPGTITIAGLGTPTVIGSQNTDANAGQILSYMIQRVAGTNFNTVVWSAE